MRTAMRAAAWAAILLAAIAALLAYRHYGVGDLLTIDTLRTSRDALVAAVADHPYGSAFFVVYVAATAASLPGATILTLAGGAMFGLAWGFVLVSFASSLGALLAFLAARYLLRDAVASRFGPRLAAIDEGMTRDGTSYLLTLRLVPAFPFWLVNLLCGLTSIGAARYYVVSQIGMIPGTLVYVNAGTQLASVRSVGDIFSPLLLGSFFLLGMFPLLAGWAVEAYRLRKLYGRWPRPKRFDRNLVVIGAGAGGLVTAYIAAAVKAKVTLIEAGRMGGDCLNTGCVPSKALLASAKRHAQMRDARSFGITAENPRVDFPAVMARVRSVIRTIEPHDSVERYQRLGVEVIRGRARLVTPWRVEVALPDGRQQSITTRSVVIATGAKPRVPNIPGLDAIDALTTDTVWDLDELPQRLLVLGGGPAGCELAQAYARLGSRVTLVETAPRLLAREDADAAALVADALRADGVEVLVGRRAVRVESDLLERSLIVAADGHEHAIAFDRLLCAVGRTPRTEGCGLEEIGIALAADGTIATNDRLQTRFPNIYAVGDVAGPYQLTHAAAHQAWHGAVNALFGRFQRLRLDYSVLPWATYTTPEFARVGLTEAEARANGTAYEVTRHELDGLDRAIADGTAGGFIKVLTVPGKDRILGVTIVGEHASDLLAEFALAMKHGIGLNGILGTVHSYPSLAEANKQAAGAWKRAHASARVLRWIERYHEWERR